MVWSKQQILMIFRPYQCYSIYPFKVSFGECCGEGRSGGEEVGAQGGKFDGGGGEGMGEEGLKGGMLLNGRLFRVIDGVICWSGLRNS